MQLFASLFALVFACLALAEPDQTVCGNNHPHVQNAIGKFCQKSDIVIPSTYAKNGMKGDNSDYAQVWIQGSCKPAQWIPQKYCFSQFYNMCATGGLPGTIHRTYGMLKPSPSCRAVP